MTVYQGDQFCSVSWPVLLPAELSLLDVAFRCSSSSLELTL